MNINYELNKRIRAGGNNGTNHWAFQAGSEPGYLV
jgi:hypothetical protein